MRCFTGSWSLSWIEPEAYGTILDRRVQLHRHGERADLERAVQINRAAIERPPHDGQTIVTAPFVP